MLDLVGDILNWAAAGVFFPLLFLPMALVLSRGNSATVAWLVIVAAIVGAALLFVWLVPILRLTPSMPKLLTFFALFVLSTGIVLLLGGARRAAVRLSAIFEIATTIAGRGVIWLLLAMALVQFGVVILRYIFGINRIFMQESITYMHGAVFLVAAGYALLTNDHVRVDIFYRDAPARRKALVDFLGTYFFLFPICLLLLWTASPYVANSWAVGEGSNEASGIQALFILKSLIPGFAMLLSMAGFTLALRAADTLERPR